MNNTIQNIHTAVMILLALILALSTNNQERKYEELQNTIQNTPQNTQPDPLQSEATIIKSNNSLREVCLMMLSPDNENTTEDQRTLCNPVL